MEKSPVTFWEEDKLRHVWSVEMGMYDGVVLERENQQKGNQMHPITRQHLRMQFKAATEIVLPTPAMPEEAAASMTAWGC